jgi:HEAT repeat protein
MIPIVALSMLAGMAVGFPLLQWGLRREPRTLLAFERRCWWLYLPLLMATASLLFVLYTPEHAAAMLMVGVAIAWMISGSGWRTRLPHAAAALLITGIFATEWAVMQPDSRGRYRVSPATRVEIAGPRAVPGFIRSLTTDTDATAYDVGMARALYQSGEQRALPVLLVALQSREPDASERAARVLQASEKEARLLHGVGSRAAPALMEVLLSGERGEGSKRQLADLLQRIAEPRSVAELKEVAAARLAEAKAPHRSALSTGAAPLRLADPPETGWAWEPLRMRLRATEVLASLGDRRAEPVLAAVLEDRRDDPGLRAGVAWALADLARARAVPVLVAALGAEEDVVRNAAAEALARIGRPSVPALMAALAGSLARGGRDLGEGDWAAWSLVKIGDPRAKPLLKAADRRSHYTGRRCVFCGRIDPVGAR